MDSAAEDALGKGKNGLNAGRDEVGIELQDLGAGREARRTQEESFANIVRQRQQVMNCKCTQYRTNLKGQE